MNRSEKIDTIRRGKPLRIADIAVLIILVVLTGFALYFIYFKAEKGAEVIVSVRGEPWGQPISLLKNRTEDIDGKLTLVIKDGSCYVTDSKCPDHVCVHMGKISRVNQYIVCAPEKIIIRIAGPSDIHGGVG